MRTIAIANQKGGVGKTTTAVNLGAALQSLGQWPLLLDLDPQGSLTAALGIDPESCERTIYDALHAAALGERLALADLIIPTPAGLDLVPANLALSVADVELSGGFRVFALRDALATLATGHTVALLDCPPNLGVLTLGALAAAGEVLIPQTPDYLASRGLASLLRQIAEVRQRGNPSLRLLGVVLTMTDRTKHDTGIEASLRALTDRGVHVCATTIPRRVAVRDAATAGQPVTAYDPTGAATGAYHALAAEVLAL